MKKFLSNILAILLTVVIVGCVSPDLPTTKSTTLQDVNNIKTITDMTSVAFEWSKVDNKNIIGYVIYKKSPPSTNYKQIAVIKDAYVTHYVDRNLKPNTQYQYQIKTFSKDSISANTESILAQTKPTIEPVSFIQALTNLPKRTKIIWRPHSSNLVTGYVVKRANKNSSDFEEIATIKGRLNAEYIDTDVKNATTYKYIVYAQTNSLILSKPSEVVISTTKKLPKGVSGLSATNNAPKKIILTWDSTQESDFSHYKIYRSYSNLLPFFHLDNSKTNTYQDLINTNGTTRYYKVSVVDKDGLESTISDTYTQGQTISQPESPIFTNAIFNSNSVELTWSLTPRATRYTIYRTGAGSDKIFKNIHGTSYTDTDVSLNNEYTYRISCVDEYGLSSRRSNSIKVSTK